MVQDAHTPTKTHPVNSQSGSQGNKNKEGLRMRLPSQYTLDIAEQNSAKKRPSRDKSKNFWNLIPSIGNLLSFSMQQNSTLNNGQKILRSKNCIYPLFDRQASDWRGEGWCAHAGILGLLTFFASSRPLLYSQGWWSI